jgi:hypothetical protein
MTFTSINKHLGLKKEENLFGMDRDRNSFMDEHRDGNQRGKEKSKLHVKAKNERNMRL